MDKQYIRNGVEAIKGRKSNIFYKDTVAIAILEHVNKVDFNDENIIIESNVFYEWFEKISNKLLMNEEYGFKKELGADTKKTEFGTILGRVHKGTEKRTNIIKTIFEMPVYKLNTHDKDKKKDLKKGDTPYVGKLYTIHNDKNEGGIEIDKKNIETIKCVYEPMKYLLLYNGALGITKGGVSYLAKTLKGFESMFGTLTRDVSYMKGCKDVLTEFDTNCFYNKNIDSSLDKEHIYSQIKNYKGCFNMKNRSIDHYKPFSKRGKDDIRNYILTSRELNSSKNDSSGMVFNSDIKKRNLDLSKQINELIKKCHVPPLHAKRMREELGVA